MDSFGKCSTFFPAIASCASSVPGFVTLADAATASVGGQYDRLWPATGC